MMKKLVCAVFVTIALLSGAAALEPPEINAKGAILAEGSTGTILFEQNADEKLFPASTTKLMTAIVALENGDLNSLVTISKEAVTGLSDQGSSVFYKAGEQMAFLDVVRYLLVASGNDGANALAETVGGTKEHFVELMNAKAKELGCTNTNFVNPHGLHDENHYTSAHDLLRIAEYAMKNETIAEIVAMPKVVLPATNMHSTTTTFYTTNHLLSRFKDTHYYYESAIGIKTGSTTPAGLCLIAAAKEGDLTYFSVVLGAAKAEDGSMGSFTETIKLLDYGRKNYSIQQMAKATDPICEIDVRLATDRDKLVLVPESGFSALLPDDFNKADLVIQHKTDASVKAPVTKGQKLGTVTFSYQGKQYGTVALVSSEEIQRSQVLFVIDSITGFFSSTVFKIIVGTVLALVVIFAVWLIIMRSRAKRRRKTSSRYRGSGRYRK